ncbi:MAG: hypothetical protein ACTSV5_13295 [Promethearchaeota archaeon]
MNQNEETMVGHQISEQFLENDAQLAGIDQEATVSFKKLIKASLLIDLSLIIPSMAGFNLYAISQAMGDSITHVYESFILKRQVQGLAKKNVMVTGQALSKFEYVNIEGLFYEKPTMDTILETASPIVETIPQVQSPIAVQGSVFISVLGFDRLESGQMVPHDPMRLVDVQQAIAKAVFEESFKKIAKMGGAITAQGEFGQTLRAIKSSSHFDSTQFAKIAETLIKYYEAIHSTESFSIDGIYDIEASTHHILKYFSKKINNGEMLNSFEEEALDLIIAIMKSNQGSLGSAYQGLFSRNGWKTVAKGGTGPSGVSPFYKLFLLKIARTLFDNDIINTDPDINLIGAVKEFTTALGKSETYYLDKVHQIKGGHLYGNKSFNFYINPLKCVKSLEGHFDFLQFIQGSG